MSKEIKILGKQSAIYGFGTILTRGIGFFLIPLYTHYLTPKDYGILEMIDLTCVVISFLLGMGITNSILRFHGQYTGEKDKEEIINTGLVFAIGFGAIITFSIIYHSKTFSLLIFNNVEYSYYFILAFVNVFLAIIHTHCKTIFRAKGKPELFVTVSVITAISAMVLNIYFIGILQIGIRGFYYSSVITFFPITLVLLIKQFTKVKTIFSVDKIKIMLPYGVFFLPTLLISFFISFSDRILLRIFTDLETVGFYALGSKIGMIVTFLLGYPFQQAWGAYAFEIEKKKNAKEIYSKVLVYYLFLLIFLALSIAIFSREIITVIADSAYLQAYTVIPLIAFSAVFLSVDYVIQIGILIKKKTHYLPFISGFVAIINILLNILLIPRYGMMGAATATLISFIILPITSFRVAQKIYPIQYEIGRIMKMVFLAVVLYLVSIFIDIDSMIQAIILKIVIIGSFPIGLMALNFLHDEEKAEIVRIIKVIRKGKILDAEEA